MVVVLLISGNPCESVVSGFLFVSFVCFVTFVIADSWLKRGLSPCDVLCGIRDCIFFWGLYEKNASPASPASPAGKKRQQLRAKTALFCRVRKRQTRHQRVTNASPNRVLCPIVQRPHGQACIIMGRLSAKRKEGLK